MAKGWKAFEMRVCRAHGVERQPVTGDRDGSDCKRHGMFSFQIKLRKSVPKSIREWSDAIHRWAQRDGTVGVLIVKEPGKHDANALVILRFDDWVALHGTPAAEELGGDPS